jgi:predicted dehydrogenase
MSRRAMLSRRGFLTIAATAAAGCAAHRDRDKAAKRAEKGPKRTVRLGIIGCGARGGVLMQNLLTRDRPGVAPKLQAVCDVYRPRREQAASLAAAQGYADWREVFQREDLDGVLIATPDHLHAEMAIGAMRAGKDVYCESPMARTLDDAARFRDVAAKTGRVVQIGAELVSESQWSAARTHIASGRLGKIGWCQGGAWGPAAQTPEPARLAISPTDLDWEAFLGSAPPRPFEPARYVNWRKYGDYSAGTAAGQFHTELAALLTALGPAFPIEVSAAGGIYAQDGREVPDSLVMSAEYEPGYTIVLTTSLESGPRRPAVIRGDEFSMLLSRNAIVPQAQHGVTGLCISRFGVRDGAVAPLRAKEDHLTNWLRCTETRSACSYPPSLGYQSAVAVSMALQAYAEEKTFRWSSTEQRIIEAPRRA